MREAVALVFAAVLFVQPLSADPPKQPKPSIVRADEGEKLLKRGVDPILIKVDPETVGSQHVAFGTETLPPGEAIRTHRHMHEEEIVLIQKGTLQVTVGELQAEATAGDAVYIPARTWIGFENHSNETAHLAFFFNEPHFFKCLRAISSRPGIKFVPLPETEMKKVSEECHMELKQ